MFISLLMNQLNGSLLCNLSDAILPSLNSFTAPILGLGLFSQAVVAISLQNTLKSSKFPCVCSFLEENVKFVKVQPSCLRQPEETVHKAQAC